ncbi:MAG: VWA domain-containing protein [Chlorobi bacterium]|nr:VWA domain-containing protein [Chlorobiota bacterium]
MASGRSRTRPVKRKVETGKATGEGSATTWDGDFALRGGRSGKALDSRGEAVTGLEKSGGSLWIDGPSADAPILSVASVEEAGFTEAEGDVYFRTGEVEDKVSPGDGGELEVEEILQVVPEPGQLTAGEWNDLTEWDFWNGVVASNDWSSMKDYWGYGKGRRISVRVDNGREPISDAVVRLFSKDGTLLWTARSDNFGRAELFTGLNTDTDSAPYDIVVFSRGKETRLGSVDPSREQSQGESPMVVRLPGDAPELKTIDVMFVIDATGSMGDELNYIKVELESVIKQVQEKLGEKEFALRLSTNVYRDQGDEYVVRSTEFTENIDDILAFLRKQRAGGGGDTPEAVEEALEDGIVDHHWSAEAQSRFLFLVLDAPPHYTDDRLNKMRGLTKQAAEKGIRIIPVASSGIDKETEFLLRFLSIHTGGTYVFLTDHSGIGNSHIEPTIGSYQVEFLNDLLVRLIVQFTERPESVDAITPRRPELR